MKTSSFITRLLREFPSTTRVHALEEMNLALSTLLDKEPLAFMRVFDESTGGDPVLSTTAGVFAYTIDDTNLGSDINRVERAYTGREEDPTWCDSKIHTSRNIGSNDTKIIFSEDPGGVDVKLKCYKGRTELLSETYPAEIPLPEEFIIEHLYELIAGRLERMYHGKSVRLERYLAYDLPRFYGDANYTIENSIIYSTDESRPY